MSVMPSKRIPDGYHWRLLSALNADLDTMSGGAILDHFPDLHKSVRDRDFGLYDQMAERSSLQSIWAQECRPSVTALAALRMSTRFLSKLDVGALSSEPYLQDFRNWDLGLDHLDRQILFTDGRCLPYVDRVREEVRRILGENPSESLLQQVKHGPGATYSLPYGYANFYTKFTESKWQVAPGAWCALVRTIKDDDRLLRLHNLIRPEIVLEPHNKVVTVPKDRKRLRVIAKEPTFSMYLQLGAGKHIFNLLRNSRNPIHSQRLNQLLARDGSRGEGWSTIDLKNASDSIRHAIVSTLLPPSWFAALAALRSPRANSDIGSWRYVKFCSMGNGFTFPLETVIFLAISRVLCKEALVYGDDIVVRDDKAAAVIGLLEEYGFSVNSEKSFTTGPCRESCGTDWYNGKLVTPVYLRQPIRDVADLYSVYNRLYFWFRQFLYGTVPGRREGPLYSVEFSQTKVAKTIMKYIPEKYRIYGPVMEGVRFFLINDELWPNWQRGTKYRALLEIPQTRLPGSMPEAVALGHDLRHCVSDSGSRFKVVYKSSQRLGHLHLW